MITTLEKSNTGIYLHIPFCKQACHYCNFHFSTNFQLKSLVIESICRELVLRQNYLGNVPITSIYFGGGTPSVLTLLEIEKLLNHIFKYFSITKDIEITLEGNPDDLTLEKLQGFRHIGINRLSIGIQSFNDHTLRYMNRAHTATLARQSIIWARKAQFNNLNIDLIYATTGTTTRDWQNDLTEALLLEPEHISAYCLTIEPKTVFGHWYKQGKITEISEEIAAEQFELAIDILNKKGYIHYEISNFCQPEKFSRHNINYWKSGAYLGIGPGAHGYNGVKRYWNISNNPIYIKSIQKGELPHTEETLTITNHINEYIMTSIRTYWGCDFEWMHKQYGVDLMAQKRNFIQHITQKELAYLTHSKLYLTNSGKLLADKIASELFIDN